MTDKSPIFSMAEPIKNMASSLGTISIFTINMGNQMKLMTSLGDPLANTDPHEYIKKLAMYTCYRKSDLKDGMYKPDQLSFTREDMEKLTGEELEEIAKIYVGGNDYLFKKAERKETPNEKGQTVLSFEYNEIEHPKEAGESYIQYLHRLACLEEQKTSERLSKFSKLMAIPNLAVAVPNLGMFSKKLTKGIASHMVVGNALSESLEAMGRLPRAEIQMPQIPEVTPIDWDAIERQNEKRRREPFNDLAKRLDALVDSSVQASQFMIEANRIQMEIASEIKASSDATDEHAGKNIKLSYVVIFLTILGLLLAGWATFFNAPDTTKSEALLGDISRSLVQINTNLESNQTELIKTKNEIEKIQATNASYNNEITRLKEKIHMLEMEQKNARQ